MVKEYIDREAALSAIKQAFEKGERPSLYIKSIPAADVAPVRHGRWIDSGDYVTTAYGSLPVKMCSECHMDVTLDDFDNYCTHCGAKMDKEEVCKENTKNT